jgi:hypothetical protein
MVEKKQKLNILYDGNAIAKVLTSNPKQFCISFSVSILFLIAKASFLESFRLLLNVSITSSSSARSEKEI